MPKTFQSGPFSLVRDGDSLSCRLFGAEVDRIRLTDLPADGACEVRLPLATTHLVFEADQPVEIMHFYVELSDAARADLLSDEAAVAAETVEEPAPKKRTRRSPTTA